MVDSLFSDQLSVRDYLYVDTSEFVVTIVFEKERGEGNEKLKSRKSRDDTMILLVSYIRIPFHVKYYFILQGRNN